MSLLDAPLDRVVRIYAGFSFGGNHLNRFTYLADSALLTTSSLLALLIEFDAVVLAAVSQIQSTSLVWTTHSASVLSGSRAFAMRMGQTLFIRFAFFVQQPMCGAALSAFQGFRLRLLTTDSF